MDDRMTNESDAPMSRATFNHVIYAVVERLPRGPNDSTR